VGHIRRVEGRGRIEASTAWTEAGGLQPACFFLEAVSQAAGWLIAASTNFTRRGLPLAIGSARVLGELPPGAPADLVAEITNWRDLSAQLRGSVVSRGRVVGEAAGLCGLVDAEELEASAATRAAFAALRNPPASRQGTTAGPRPVEAPGAPSIDALDARSGRATWLVTGGERLFADHFPRLPLLPGTLQLQALVNLAQAVVGAANGQGWVFRELREVRFRRPVRPGERLVLEVEARGHNPAGAALAGRALVDGQRAASIEQIHFGPAA
jgi:3-hydroxyacyl-[acyl-carrier-protein] dehydratase